jgi:hypothetical protein
VPQQWQSGHNRGGPIFHHLRHRRGARGGLSASNRRPAQSPRRCKQKPAEAGVPGAERSFSSCSKSLYCGMISSEKSATFRDHAPVRPAGSGPEFLFIPRATSAFVPPAEGPRSLIPMPTVMPRASPAQPPRAGPRPPSARVPDPRVILPAGRPSKLHRLCSTAPNLRMSRSLETRGFL